MIEDKVYLPTGSERLLIAKIVDAWNIFTTLDGYPTDDVDFFRRAVHNMQRIVYSRICLRAEDYNLCSPKMELESN